MQLLLEIFNINVFLYCLCILFLFMDVFFMDTFFYALYFSADKTSPNSFVSCSSSTCEKWLSPSLTKERSVAAEQSSRYQSLSVFFGLSSTNHLNVWSSFSQMSVFGHVFNVAACGYK